jgi:2-amino-4-hydroxy-6-hydroxymethyldihydropteridine diphosphokinase
MRNDTDNIEVFLSIGSNLGDREENLKLAVCKLHLILENMQVSSIYETDPLYMLDQPHFLNAVISGCTSLNHRELLDKTQAIELDMGRNKNAQTSKGPRLIDIDILLYDNLILHEPELVIPHPGIAERKFVLIPLLELASGIVDPVSGMQFSEFMGKVSNQVVTLFKKWEN